MAILRVLHLSDLHLTKKSYNWSRIKNLYLPVFDKNALEGLAQLVFANQKQFDALIISGDIADTGQGHDLKFAQDFFDLPPDNGSSIPWLHSNKPTLKSSNKTIVLIPGNHDNFSNSFGIPGGAFDGFFQTYWKPSADKVQVHFLPNSEKPILAIVCADFGLKRIQDSNKPGGFWGQGKAYQERVCALAEQTKKLYMENSVAVIWMIHFAPRFEESDKLFDDRLQLIDSDLLLQKAQATGVRYIFCGHTHKLPSLGPFYSSKNYPDIKILCAGTATCIASRYDTAIHLRAIEINGNVITKIKNVNLFWNSDKLTYSPR